MARPVVTNQPAKEWMPLPAGGGMSGCPPGLEYLAQLDQLIVKQQVHLLEVLTGWEVRNKFEIHNSMAQQVFYAAEESTCMQRQCCGPARGFLLHITDNNGREVIRIERQFKCCAVWNCCWCANKDGCAWEMSVEAPPGNPVGYIRQSTSKWKHHMTIMDADRTHLFSLWGPCCPCQGLCCRADVDFPIYVKDDNSIAGKIAKQWGGTIKEFFTDADIYSVTFPIDMDPKNKALLLGAAFMVDMMVFETQKSNNNY